MRKGEITRERILDAAEAIVLERSFHGVGLNQILTAVGVPKGSFYHYFASKEQFGVEMLRHYAERSAEQRRRILANRDVEPDPLRRILLFLNSVMAKVVENGGRWPCLLMKLAGEVSCLSEAMREVLAGSYRALAADIRENLEEAVAAGQLPADTDTAALAAFIVDLWSGAQQRAVVLRAVGPMQNALESIQERLRNRDR